MMRLLLLLSILTLSACGMKGDLYPPEPPAAPDPASTDGRKTIPPAPDPAQAE